MLRRERGKSFDGGIFAKEFGRDAVYVHVRRLGGEDGRDQEFPGARVGERAGDIGIKLVEALQDFGDALGREGSVGMALLTLGAARALALLGRSGAALAHVIPFAFARFVWCRLRGRERPRHTVLTAGAGGLTGHVAAGHEGNILAETSVTTGMIDWLDRTR